MRISLAKTQTITDRLSTLSEISRLRLLRLLECDDLSVGELASILQMPQSTVSRHLKVLLEAGWISRRAEGTAGRYWFNREALSDEALSLWKLVREQLGETTQTRQDAHRLRDVQAQRRTASHEFFGRVGAEWDTVRREMFGEHFTEEALLALLPSDWVIADIGCGTGEIASRLAPHVKKVHAVDMSKSMLDAARKRVGDLKNVEFHEAEITSLPFRAGSIDAACVSLVLHHVEDPEAALKELVRIVRHKTGRVLILDMVEHERTEYRHRMGHVHLGFNARSIEKMMRDAGLTNVSMCRLSTVVDAKGPELFVVIGTRK